MEIISAVLQDAQGIASVHVRSWQSAYAGILAPSWLAALSVADKTRHWQQSLMQKSPRTLVVRHDGGIAGFISFGACRDAGAPATYVEVWALYVAPEYGGRGVGRSLMNHALEQIQAEGFQATHVWVLAANQRGIKFYESCGFQRRTGSEKDISVGGQTIEEVAYARPCR